MIPRDPVRALEAARQCLLAYDHPTWSNGHAQLHSEVKGGVQYIAIAGTNDGWDVLRDIALFPFLERDNLGDARNGCWDAWEPVRDAVLDLITGLPLVIRGHSLGGFHAQATATYLHRKGMQINLVETFGALQGWGKIGAALIQERKIPILNWKNGYCPVFGRPALSGRAVGEQAGVHCGKILERPMGVMAGLLRPFVRWQYHRLEGDKGYIRQFERCVEGVQTK